MFTLYEKHPVLNRISFHIHDVPLGLVNAIRRIVISEIPNVAPSFQPYDPSAHDIQISINESSIHNEILGHRISMIPIHFTSEEIDTFTPDQYKFVITKQCTGSEPLYVTTNDIQVFDVNGQELSQKFRDRLFPLDPITRDPIIITKLKPNLFKLDQGEKLELSYTARLQTAINNSAWCPVSLAAFNFVVDDAKCKVELASRLAEVPNTDVKKQEEVTKLFETLEKQRFYKVNKYEEPNDIKFTIESECGLTPDYLFYKAIDVLKSKLTELLSKEKYKITSNNTTTNMYTIEISEEGHTLGNFIQTFIYDQYIRDGYNSGVTYVGYTIEHPLTKKLLLKLAFSKVNPDIESFIREFTTRSIELCDDIQKTWIKWSAGKSTAPGDLDGVVHIVSKKKGKVAFPKQKKT